MLKKDTENLAGWEVEINRNLELTARIAGVTPREVIPPVKIGGEEMTVPLEKCIHCQVTICDFLRCVRG